MIEIQHLAKAFALGKNSKLSDTEKQDVRYSKEAFHSVREVSLLVARVKYLACLGQTVQAKPQPYVCYQQR